MTYAYDVAVPLPVKDLYDTLVMQMSLNAAKDMYDRGLKLIEDFYNKYGDFMSPFAKDMERYGQIVGGLRDVVNQAYANGIDPLRSPEGRALVAQAIRSVNPAEMNAMRANAKTGYAYLDALQALRKAGKYSLAQEDFDIALTGGPQFADFATNNGAGGFAQWDRMSPILATTLRELTQDSYKGRTPRTLTEDDFKNDPRLAGKYAYDPRYEWTGYLDSDLMKVAPGASASLAGDPRAAYFREMSKQRVIASGKKPTAENIEAQFLRDIADANEWALVDPTRKADEYAVLEQKHKNAVALENLNHKHAMARQAAAGSGKGKGDQNVPVIFREAAARAGGEVNYAVDQNPHYQWIDPLLQGARVVKGGKGNYAYNIPASQTAFIYKKNERNFDGSRVSARFDYGFANSDATFIPTGQMRMELDFNGQPHYYITGTLANNNTGREVIGRDGTELYEMEVTERAFNYGKKQETAYYPTN